MGTGGLGGVHRGFPDPPDVSADLGELVRTEALIVSSGVKSILDVPATLERLETMLALVEGWVDEVVSQATAEWMPAAIALAEVVRRARATGGPAEETFATLVGLELRPRRMRDAANLWAALRDAAKRPAILLAGNGHVRLDYGVPQVIAAAQPAAKVVSVGFVEIGEPVRDQPYTHVWVTLAVPREDVCAAMGPAR